MLDFFRALQKAKANLWTPVNNTYPTVNKQLIQFNQVSLMLNWAMLLQMTCFQNIDNKSPLQYHPETHNSLKLKGNLSPVFDMFIEY